MRMKKARAAAAALLCAACLAQTAAPALAAEAYTAPDVTGKTLEQLMGDFRAEHALTEDNFEISFYVPETGERYDFNETKLLYGASTYKLPLNLYYYDMQLAGEITGDTMITRGASLDEAHYQTLVYSNNELAYSLWRRIGDWPEYKTAMRKYFTMTDDEIPQNYYYDHVFCTRMMMDTLKVVWDGQEQYPELIDYLKIACPGAYFKTYLDVDETPVAHKYGSYEGAENDVGIIWAERPFLLAVYTHGLSYGPGGNVDMAYADGQSAGSVVCGQLAVLLKTYLDEQLRVEREQAAPTGIVRIVPSFAQHFPALWSFRMSTTASAMTSALNAPTQARRMTRARCAACLASSCAASSAALCVSSRAACSSA